MRRHSSRQGRHSPRRYTSNKLRSIERGVSSPYSRRLRIEPLEDRSLLSAVSWDGGGDGKNWSDASNWSGNVLPGADDDVTIDAPGAVSVTFSSASQAIHSLTVAADDLLTIKSQLTVAAASTISGTLIVSSSTLTLNGATSVHSLALSPGTINGVGDLSVTGNVYWNGGTMSGLGRTIVESSASLEIGPFGPCNIDRLLVNNGTIDWNGPALAFHNGTILNNGSFASYSTSFDAGSIRGLTGTNAFVNNGSFIKAGVASVAVTSAAGATMQFNNSGLIDVQTNSLDLGAGGVNSGAVSISDSAKLRVTSATYSFAAGANVTGAGAIEVAGGTLSVDGSTSAPRLILSSGTLTGAADLTVTQSLDWTNGSMTGAGKTIVAPTATLSLSNSNSSTPIVLGRYLQNDGVAIWTTGDLHFAGGTFQNNGSLFAAGTSISLTLNAFADSGVNAFNNSGAFSNVGVGGVRFAASTTSAVRFNNSGKVQGLSTNVGSTASVQLNGGGTFNSGSVFAGTVSIGRSANVTPTAQFGSNIEVDGTLSIALVISTDTPVTFTGSGVVTVANGVSGSGDLTFESNAIWGIGPMAGTGKTIIAPGANVTLGGAFTLSRVLENNGALVWLSSANVTMNNGVVQNNGTILVAYDGVGFGVRVNSSGGINAINNAGLFLDQLMPVSPTSPGMQINVPLNNSGTLHGGTDRLELTAGGISAPGAIFAGSVSLTGGVFVFAPNTVVTGTLGISTPISFAAPASFTGSGAVVLNSALDGDADVTFNTTLAWTAGTMSGTGRIIIGPQGLLTLGGSTAHVLNRALENNGATLWTGGDLALGAALSNNGLFRANASATLSAYGTNSAAAFENAGEFVHEAGATKFSVVGGFGAPFNNSGLVMVISGALQLDAGGTSSGAFDVAGGATLSFGAGVYGIVHNAEWTGGGDYQVSGATVNVDENISVASLKLSGGVIAGSANLTVTGGLNWNGGTMSGAGTTVIAPSATLNFLGGLTVSRTMQNDGLATLAYSSMGIKDGTFQNNGTFVVASFVAGTTIRFTGGHSEFVNSGVMRNASASTSGALTVESGITFQNSGLLDGGKSGVILAGGGIASSGATFAGNVSLSGGAFDFGGTVTVTGVLAIAAPLNADEALAFAGAGIVNLSSTLSGAGDVIFEGSLQWTGGAMTGSGTSTIASTAILTMSSSSILTLNRTLENDGGANWLSGKLAMTDGVFQNNGTVQSFGGGGSYGLGGTNVFNNAGTFRNYGANPILFYTPFGLYPVAFNNAGVVDGRIGSVQISAGGTHSAGATFAGAIELGGNQVFGATAIVTGSMTIAAPTTIDSSVTFQGPGSINVASDLTGSGDITIENRLNWTKGVISGPGKLSIAPIGSFHLQASQQSFSPELNLQRNLQNDGTVIWAFPNLWLTNSVIQNNGAFIVQSDNVAYGVYSSVAGSAFNNAGEFILNSSFVDFSASIGAGVPFNNTGTIDATYGTLGLWAGGTHGPGAVFGGNVKLQGGIQTFDTTVIVTGTLIIATPISFSTPLTLSGPGSVTLSAPLSGSADITFDTAVTWTSGMMSGSGKTIIGPSGTLYLSGATNDLNRTLINNGTAYWTKGDLRMSGGIFQNNGSLIASSKTPLNSYGTGGVNAFNNSGVFANQGAGLVKFYANNGSGVSFNNSGTANGGTGGLEIAAGGQHADGATFLGTVLISSGAFAFGATTNLQGVLTLSVPWDVTSPRAFNGSGKLVLSVPTTLSDGMDLTGTATLNLASTISSGTPITWTQPVEITGTGTINSPATLNTLLISGILTGTGDIAVLNQLTWTAGQMTGTGAMTVPSSASFLINGSGHSLARPLRTDGNTIWDGMGVSSSAVWQNYGKIIVNLNYVWNGFNVSPGLFGGNNATFINFGSMISVGPSTLATLGLFDNEGVLDIRNGITQMSGTYSGSGVIVGAPAGTLLMVTDLISTTTNPAQFSGLGNVQFQTDVFTGPVVPLLLEAQSEDLGNTAAGFLSNSAIQSLSLGPWPFGATYVRLVDQSNNASGNGPEAVYVDNLVVPAGRTLDLNGLHLYVRDAQIAGLIKGGQVTRLVPEVSQVLVASTGWATEFYNELQTADLGDGGYAIPGNALDQLRPLPWSNLDQIKIVFNEDVNVQADSLTISSANLDVISIIPLNFTYDNSSHTATWTLAQPIGNDTISLSLASTGPAAVTDSHGAALDGEWPSATGNFPSGDGATGGDFHFSFNVLPGDVSHDGVVDIQDITNVANHWLQAGPLSDANGDGVVNIQETTLIANQWLQSNGNAAVSGASASAQSGGGANADDNLESLVASTSAVDSMSDSGPGIPANDLAGGPAPCAAPEAPPASAASVATMPALLTAASEKIAAVVEGPSPIVPQPIASQAPWLAVESGTSVDINGADDQAVEVSTVAKRIGEHPSVLLAAAVDQALATMDERVLRRHQDVLPWLSASLATAPKPLGKSPLRAIARQS